MRASRAPRDVSALDPRLTAAEGDISLVNTRVDDVTHKRSTPSKLNIFPPLKPITIFTSIADLTVTGTGTVETDTILFKTGTQSCKITATAVVTCTKTISKDFTDKSICVDFYVHDRTKFTGMELLFGFGADWSKYFYYQIEQVEYINGWNRAVIPSTAFTLIGGALSSDLANINKMRFKINPTGGDAIVSIDRFALLDDQATRGKVILAFDDGEQTVYTEAKKRMDEYGMRGVAYVFATGIDQAGYMTLDQLNALYDSGWDIASHTYSHSYMVGGGLTDAQIDEELRLQKKWLLDNGFVRGANHLASPGGQYNDSIVEMIKKYYFTHRTINTAYEFNPPFDPYRIRIQNVINTTTVPSVQGWIDRAVARKQLLVLTFHYIVDPANASTKILPATFQSIIDYINTANIDVVTWSDLE